MSTLFSVPTTPSNQTPRSSRPRYNSDTTSTHSQSCPSNIDPTLNQTPTPTHTQVRHHANSVSSVRSQRTPKSIIDYTNNNSNQDNSNVTSPLSASSTHDSRLRTPFVQHAVPPSPQQERQPGTPPTMPAYHPSPSPTTTYGINGGLIVSSNASNMPSGNGSECQPLLPSQPDVFMNGKNGRPVLRPTLSHNSVLTPASVNWSRPRAVAEGDHRPATTDSGIVYTTTQQGTESGHTPHEASAPFSQPQSAHSVATQSSYAAAPPPSSAHPHSSSHTQPMPINSGNPYSDPEVSYQSAAYSGSYDSSYEHHSPWAAPATVEGSLTQYHHHPYYPSMPAGRIEEPILGPGEVPAPRPPISYAALIGEALLLAPPPHQLYVSEISESIKRRYVYYRQNPTKVYNGVRHQTSMCKAFVKMSRPYGDQSGGARKWAIRAGCETWFANGGCRQPSSEDFKKSTSPQPNNRNGKAKATARAKQLAIGTSSYNSRSPKMSHKVKQEAYGAHIPGGPSNGPAYDGSGKPSYAYHPYLEHQAQSYPAPYAPPGYHYVPIHPQHHGHGHPMMQGYPPIQNGYHAQPPTAHPGSPSEEASPLMTPATGYAVPHPHPYPHTAHYYAQAGQNQNQQYWAPSPPGDWKPFNGMPPPPSAHPYNQSEERGHGQSEQHSPGSYDDHSPHDQRGRDNSAELSPAH